MSTDEQAIRNLVTEWQQAMRDGDADRLRPLMAEDVTFLTPGQPPMRGRDQFVEGMRLMLKNVYIDATSEIQEIQVSGDLAYCCNRISVAITPIGGGNRMNRAGFTLAVLHKEVSGSWVMLRDANMVMSVDDDG